MAKKASSSRNSRSSRSARPAREENQGDIFDHFAATGRMERPASSRESEREDRGGSDAATERILARLEAMEQDNRTLRDQLLRATPAPQPARVSEAPGNLDLTSNMPDMFTDPEGYKREMQSRVNAHVSLSTRAAAQEIRQETSIQSRADQLWADFQSTHGEWAEHGELVGIVASQLVERAKARGLDGEKYIFSDPAAFYTEVDKVMRTKYGALLAQDDDEDYDEGEFDLGAEARDDMRSANFTGGPGDDDDEDDGRTSGVFGGQESGGRPSPGKKGEGKGSDMISDLQNLQKASGFF